MDAAYNITPLLRDNMNDFVDKFKYLGLCICYCELPKLEKVDIYCCMSTYRRLLSFAGDWFLKLSYGRGPKRGDRFSFTTPFVSLRVSQVCQTCPRCDDASNVSLIFLDIVNEKTIVLIFLEKSTQKLEVVSAKTKCNTPLEYRQSKCFHILKINSQEKLIVPLKIRETNIQYYVVNEELFSVPYETRTTIGHGGRTRMHKELQVKCNISLRHLQHLPLIVHAECGRLPVIWSHKSAQRTKQSSKELARLQRSCLVSTIKAYTADAADVFAVSSTSPVFRKRRKIFAMRMALEREAVFLTKNLI